jgi:hypothetical protein
MVGRGELTETAWAAIAPLLPALGRRGGQWRDHRMVINGHPVEAAHRGALARPAAALRPLADVRGTALPLATRGDVGPGAGPRADALGRGGGGGLGGEYR